MGADAQVVPLTVYNGMPFPIRLNSVVVRNTATCGQGSTSVLGGIVIAPMTTYTVAPIMPGNPAVEWAGAKVTDLSVTNGLRSIHPYFSNCWLPSANFGPLTMKGYWYPIGSSPMQVLKIYPF